MKKYIFFFGPPGSGKGTQVDMLGQYLEIPVLSPGELLRHEEEMHTKLGAKIQPLIDNGKMVPDRIVEEMVAKRLSKKDAVNGVIFDGYPRDMDQLEFICEKLRNKVKKDDLIAAFFIHVPDKEIKQRLAGRRVCDCGASYHLSYNPPKKADVCDLCGNKLEIRKDDRPAVIKDRLKYYHKSIRPLLEYWKKSGKLFKINGEKDIRDIHKEIRNIIKGKKGDVSKDKI
jgi:adenylate kinase